MRTNKGLFLMFLAFAAAGVPEASDARSVLSLNWGYINVRNAVFNRNLTDLESIGTFSYLDLEAGDMGEERGTLVGIGGFQVKNDYAGQEFYKLTQISGWVITRYFLVPSDPKQLSRPFIDIGPSLSHQSYEILSNDETKYKLGAVVGVGLVVKRLGVVRLRYSYVDKQGEIDASSFQLVFGRAWGF
jgi:hypothetical protein